MESGIVDGLFHWALGFLLGVSLPFSGQLVGYLSYRLLRRHQDFVAHFVGVIVPPLGFFYHFKWLVAPESFNRLVTTGLGFQLLFGILIHLSLHSRHKLTGEDVNNLR